MHTKPITNTKNSTLDGQNSKERMLVQIIMANYMTQLNSSFILVLSHEGIVVSSQL